MKHVCLTLTGLLVFLACKGNPSPAPPLAAGTTGSPSLGPPHAAGTSGYTLRIEFSGLIGFAKGVDVGKDAGKVWAFLPNAVYDPDHLDRDEDLLPPGFLAAASRANAVGRESLARILPMHYAWIRFRNANVTATNPDKKFEPEKGRSIAGGDLRFRAHYPGPVHVSADFCHLSDVAEVAKALSSAPLPPDFKLSKLRALDELDRAFLKTPLDHHLAARALVEAGTIHALLRGHGMDSTKKPAVLGYTTDFNAMRGSDDDAVELATEVDVEQTGLNGKVTVDVSPGDSIEIEPRDAAEPVVIDVFNDIAEVRDNQQVDMNKYADAQAFRWFYRLVPLTTTRRPLSRVHPSVIPRPTSFVARYRSHDLGREMSSASPRHSRCDGYGGPAPVYPGRR